MHSIRVDADKLPAHIARHVGAKSVEIYLTESVNIGSQAWSEGSRDIYHVAALDSSDIKPISDDRPWPQNMYPLGNTKLPMRFVIIKTGTFCGKTATPFIYARAEDVTPMLPAALPDMTHRTKQVLRAMASYNSAGRKRFREDFKVSDSEWEAEVSKLVALGFATKRGSVTTEGHNAARKISDMIINMFSPEAKG